MIHLFMDMEQMTVHTGDVNIGGVIKGGNKRLIPVLKAYSFDNNNK